MKHDRAFHPLDPRSARTRLILAIAGGLIAWLVAAWPIAATTRALLAWDVAGLVLVGVAGLIITRSDARETRRRAAAYDPGRRVVWILVLIASTVSLLAATIVVRQGREGMRALHVALCVATVAISWLVTHSAFTLRYAHLYYREDDEGIGGAEFPGGAPPSYLDFAYLAFTIGMTFQVSDTQVSSRQIRQTVLVHAMLSFVYSTAILAFILNLVASMAG